MMVLDLENEGFEEEDDTPTAMVDVFFGFSGGFLGCSIYFVSIFFFSVALFFPSLSRRSL
ncbi:hypothetical protein Syun_015641 [Stephania yunnanensis]|uniref:Transmembrane protein n=1 Tax=Stephania yunnanensis TaxID=152371 RepID=A0AAP0JLJ9_9MAGN